MQQVTAELATLRQIKDADEVRRLRRAVGITTEAFLDAMAAAKPGMYEYEVEATLEYGFRRRGAERVGFPSIVGSGPNGTILHYDENRRRMEEGELVVIDVGAEYGYYSADLTRTLPVSGRFTPRQRRLYDLVLGAQQAAIDSVRPGTSLGTLNQIARDVPADPVERPLRGLRLRPVLHPRAVALARHGRPRSRARTPGGWNPGWS